MEKLFDTLLYHGNKIGVCVVISILGVLFWLVHIDYNQHKTLREEIVITVKNKHDSGGWVGKGPWQITAENEVFTCSSGIYQLVRINEKYEVVVSGKKDFSPSFRHIISAEPL